MYPYTKSDIHHWRKIKIGTHQIEIDDPTKEDSSVGRWLLTSFLVISLIIALSLGSWYYFQDITIAATKVYEAANTLFRSIITEDRPFQGQSVEETTLAQSSSTNTPIPSLTDSSNDQPPTASDNQLISQAEQSNKRPSQTTSDNQLIFQAEQSNNKLSPDNQSLSQAEQSNNRLSPTASDNQSLSQLATANQSNNQSLLLASKPETHQERELEISSPEIEPLTPDKLNKPEPKISSPEIEPLTPEKIPESTLKPSVDTQLSETQPVTDGNFHFKPSVNSELSETKVSSVDNSPNLAALSLQNSTIMEAASLSSVTDEIKTLLQRCDNHFQANRLTTGRGGTALACYQQVLTQAPNNPEAQAGLQKIEDRYLAWAGEALKKGQFHNMRLYLERGQSVNPNSTRVIKTIEVTFQDLIESALAANRWTQAHHYLEELKQINPESPLLVTFKQNLVETTPLLLAQCDQHFQADRLTFGQGGNAFDCYQRILAYDPENVPAQAGLTKIADRYQQWAESALQQKRPQSAQKYITRLAKVHPQSLALPKLRRDLINLQKRFTASNRQTRQQTVKSSQRSSSVRSTSSTAKTTSRPQSTASQRSSKRASPAGCNEIFSQESLGIRPLTQAQRTFKQRYCNP